MSTLNTPEFTQNTPEWLEIRKSKIGASDASIIMGVSPYTTPYQLWEEKVGISEGDNSNYATDRGKRLEPIALQHLEAITGLMLASRVIFHIKHDWMMASLDASSLDGEFIAEIKCGSRKEHEDAREGKVPDKYYPQLQHQIECSGLEKNHYYSFYELEPGVYEGIMVEVPRDDEYIKMMLKEEKLFYKRMKNLDAPSLTIRDYVEKKGWEWDTAADVYKKINAEIESLKEQSEIIRKELIELADGQSSRGSGIKIRKSIPKGRVNYGSIPELIGVNLDAYRSPSKEVWTITIEKEAETNINE